MLQNSPVKCSFLVFIFVPFIYLLFSKETILNFHHGWVCQRPIKFHIRNRRKLFAAASTCRRRKFARTRFFCKQKLISQKTKIYFTIFFIIIKQMNFYPSCEKINVVFLFKVWFFGSEIQTRYILYVRCSLVDHLSEPDRSFLMNFLKIFSS